jgi:ribose 1,5-bisphosphokinase
VNVPAAATARTRAGCSEPGSGQLYCVIGGAGVNADRLLAHARRRIAADHPIIFAHRYVTSSLPVIANRNVALSAAEFELRRRHGLFVLDWESHGLRYGIGNEVNYWLARGLCVAVSAARAVVGRALELYPDSTVIWAGSDGIGTARTDALANAALGATSLARRSAHAGLEALVPAYRAVHIGDGPIAALGERLVSVLVSGAP